MKNFKGKAIYNPSGKAGEYSYWACNFYKGCSGLCSYCYCKKGVLAKTLGGDNPELKACFKNEEHAYKVFSKELEQNRTELREHGLFFSFTTDPMLPETWELTKSAMAVCILNHVPIKLLTKQTQYVNDLVNVFDGYENMITIGFTLTGHDELEPCCASNAERIKAMKKLHDVGFKTWASIEPILDFKASYRMIFYSRGFCDHYKIGLESGKVYKKTDTDRFRTSVNELIHFTDRKITVYWKDSIFKYSSLPREKYSFPSFCVRSDYNIFT